MYFTALNKIWDINREIKKMIGGIGLSTNKTIPTFDIKNTQPQLMFKGNLQADIFVKSTNSITFTGKTIDKSVDYYDKNAQTYFDTTKNVDMEKQYTAFLELLKPGAKILDAGCGSGRDSKNFIEKGYSVTAIDGSTELAKKASSFIGQEVMPLKFNQLKFKNEFDGVWACASLVHIPKKEFDESFTPLVDSLKEGGYLYTCMKLGEGESEDNKGRPFSYYSWDELEAAISKQPDLKIVKMFSSDDKLKRADTGWVNIIAQKTSQ